VLVREQDCNSTRFAMMRSYLAEMIRQFGLGMLAWDLLMLLPAHKPQVGKPLLPTSIKGTS
jgi:hypothetical protein